MRKIYKPFQPSRTVFYALFVMLVTVFSGPALAASDDVFTVEGVEVDITAEDAMVAREKAFEQAQQAAFRQLAERLLPEGQIDSFKVPDASVISPMVKDFEVTQEKLSAVRYIGTYTFRFEKSPVRSFIGGQGVSYSDVGSKPVLVLPYYQWGAQTLLWGENNPWLAAWKSAPPAKGLVPVIVPIGDAQDVSDMGDNEALTYRAQNLGEMTRRYEAGEAIILLAAPSWNGNNRGPQGQAPDALTVMIYRTDRGSAEFANKLTVTKAAAWNEADVFSAAVKQSRSALQQAWKNQTAASPVENNRLKVRVRFGSVNEWVETQSKLRSVQGVDEMKLLSLKQNEASVELRFRGTEDKLRLALAQSDMTLGAPQVNYSAGYDAYAGAPGAAPGPVYDLYLNKYFKHYR